MKIQLDEKALERLIGGDSDIEVELRSNVVQAFAKRHLKGVIEEKYLKAINEEVFDELHEWVSGKWSLSDKIKQRIADGVEKVIEAEIKKFAEAQYSEIRKEVDLKVQKHLNDMEYWIKHNLNEEKGERIIEKVIRSKLEG